MFSFSFSLICFFVNLKQQAQVDQMCLAAFFNFYGEESNCEYFKN